MLTVAKSSGSFLITPNVGLMVWTLLLFGLSLLILWKYAFPRIGEALDRRQRAIELSIEEAEQIRRRADELLEEYRERLSEARQQAEEIHEQLGQFADALKENRGMMQFFFSPYFSSEEKKGALHQVIDGANPAFMNFLEALIERHRMPVVFRIRDRFDHMWEEARKLLPVEITSAIELDDAIVRSIGDRVGEQ